LNTKALPGHHYTVRVWLVVLLCLSGVARAQPEGEPAAPDPKQSQAEALFAEGQKHYDLR